MKKILSLATLLSMISLSEADAKFFEPKSTSYVGVQFGGSGERLSNVDIIGGWRGTFLVASVGLEGGLGIGSGMVSAQIAPVVGVGISDYAQLFVKLAYGVMSPKRNNHQFSIFSFGAELGTNRFALRGELGATSQISTGGGALPLDHLKVGLIYKLGKHSSKENEVKA